MTAIAYYLSSIGGVFLLFTFPCIIGAGWISFILHTLNKINKNKEITILDFLLSSFFLGSIILVFYYTVITNSAYLGILVLISIILILYSLDSLKSLANINLRKHDAFILIFLIIAETAIVLFHFNDKLSYPYGYFMLYPFVSLTISYGNPLLFNSFSYFMYLHCLLTAVVTTINVAPEILLSILPYAFISLYITGFYFLSKEYNLPAVVGILIAMSSIFIVHSTTGVLTYYAQRTFLLVLSPFYLSYYSRLLNRRVINQKIYIANTFSAPFLMLTMSSLPSHVRHLYAIAFISSFIIVSVLNNEILGVIDTIITMGFLLIHVFESLPFIFFRILSLLLSNYILIKHKTSFKTCLILLLISAFCVFCINLAPLFNVLDRLDNISIFIGSFISKLKLPLGQFGFESLSEAWEKWISIALGPTYYIIIILDIFAILWLLKAVLNPLNYGSFNNEILVLLIPGTLLSLILLIRTSEIFRFLDLMTPFILVSILFITKSILNKDLKISLRILLSNKIIYHNFDIKKILVLVLIVSTYVQYEYGIMQYSNYFYINNYRYFTKSDEFLINYVRNNYNIKRSFQLDTYEGPLIISDPYTMLTLYYSTAVEICMKEKGWITPEGYSNQSLYSLMILKEALRAGDLNNAIASCRSITISKENYKVTKIVVIINWRTIYWINSNTIMSQPPPGYISRNLENNTKMVDDFVQFFIKNTKLTFTKKVEKYIYILEINP